LTLIAAQKAWQTAHGPNDNCDAYRDLSGAGFFGVMLWDKIVPDLIPGASRPHMTIMPQEASPHIVPPGRLARAPM